MSSQCETPGRICATVLHFRVGKVKSFGLPGRQCGVNVAGLNVNTSGFRPGGYFAERNMRPTIFVERTSPASLKLLAGRVKFERRKRPGALV
jgi:hypothetical protein